MRTSIIAITALFLASCASMADRGKPLALHQETSDAGESRDAFVLRIAPRALNASREAYAAICGEIVGTGPYTLQFRTDHRTDSCDAPKTSGVLVLVNGLAVDARDAHFLASVRRPGYLVAPWVVRYRGDDGTRDIGSPQAAQ